jgi:hypothetical protein
MKEYLYYCEVYECRNRIQSPGDHYCPECREKISSGLYHLVFCEVCGRLIGFLEREKRELYLESVCKTCVMRQKKH